MDWRTPAAGQYGFFNRTELNKRIVMIGEDVKKVNPAGGIVNYGLVKKKFIFIEGSIPGSKKRIVFLRKAMRKFRTSRIAYVKLTDKTYKIPKNFNKNDY